MKNITITFLLFLFFSVQYTYAQRENCAGTLKRAEKLFDEGKLEEMHEALSVCFPLGFNKSQKLRAYELIIQALLADENFTEAEIKMVRLLKLDPTYSIEKKVLTSEFVNLYEQLKMKPIISVGVFGGPSFTRNIVTEEFGNHNIQESHGDYSSVTGFYVGALTEFYITHHILADVEFLFSRNSYNYELNDALPATNSAYTETQDRAQLPISIKYQYPIGRISPFAQLGVAPGYVVRNVVTAERLYRDNSLPPVSSANIDVTYKRNAYSVDAFAGAGVNYRYKRSTVYVSLRYALGLLPYVDDEAHVNDPEYSSKYFILDDKFTIHSMAFIAGYSFSFYKLNKKVDY